MTDKRVERDKGKFKYFVSFTKSDNEPDADGVQRVDRFKTQLRTEVTNQGLVHRVQFADYYSNHDKTSQDDIKAIIDKEIADSDFLVALLSPSYLNPKKDPNWCLYELKNFIDQRGATNVFPIRLARVECPQLKGIKHRNFFIPDEDDEVVIPLLAGTGFTKEMIALSTAIKKKWDEQNNRPGPPEARVSSLAQLGKPFSGRKLLEKAFLIDGAKPDAGFVHKVGSAIKDAGAQYVGFVAKALGQSRYDNAGREWRNSVNDSDVVVLVRSKGLPEYMENRAIAAARHIAAGDERVGLEPGKSGRMVVMIDAAKDYHEPSDLIRSMGHLIKPVRVNHGDAGACARQILKLVPR